MSGSGEKQWRVTARIGKSMKTELVMGRHTLTTDEPERFGGNDDGPNPYDLVLAALGACTLMTIRSVADKRGYPLDEAEIAMAYREVKPEEGGEGGAPPREDRIDRHIRLVGNLDDAQRKRLQKAADQCPVHRSYERGIDIVTHFDDEK